MSFKDKAFCASLNCVNECGRQMSEEEKKQMNKLLEQGEDIVISQGYFCSSPSSSEMELLTFNERPSIVLQL